MVLLTLVEKIEIVNLARNRTYQEAAEIFNHHHPNRARPLHKVTVARLFKKFRESGDLNRKKRTKSIYTINATNAFKNEVAQRFNNNPHSTTRNVARQMGTSQWKVWSTLKEMDFFPYKKAKHQKLKPDDPPRRKFFCDEMLHIIQRNPDFQQKILWTDEKPFHMNGCFNRQNRRYY